MITSESHDWAKLISKAIFYASIQASCASCELSSKYSVMNFSKDQKTLQRGADALKSYLVIATVWTIGTMLTLYANYGIYGMIAGLIANLIMTGWIFLSYMHAFQVAAKENKLEFPKVFTGCEWGVMLLVVVLGAVGFYMLQK